MSTKRLFGILTFILVAAALLTVSQLAPAAAKNKAPDQVVHEFYRWYLESIGEGENRQNPLAEGAHQDRPDLTESFKLEIDQTLAQSERGGADPLLLAQDVPVRIEVISTGQTGKNALVTVEMYWGGNPVPSERNVFLMEVQGEWKIAGVGF